MTLVIDASVALKWVIDEPGSEKADILLNAAMIAPDLFQAEIGHVLTRHVRRTRLSAEQARSGFSEIMSRVALLPMRALGEVALEISLALRHSMHDCYYLAAAEASGRPLVTADAVFVAKLRGMGRGELVYLLGEEVPDV